MSEESLWRKRSFVGLLEAEEAAPSIPDLESSDTTTTCPTCGFPSLGPSCALCFSPSIPSDELTLSRASLAASTQNSYSPSASLLGRESMRSSLRDSLRASFGDEISTKVLEKRSQQPRLPLGDRVVFRPAESAVLRRSVGGSPLQTASPLRASQAPAASSDAVVDDDSESPLPLLLNLNNIAEGSELESILGGKAGSLARLLRLGHAGSADEAAGLHPTLDRIAHANIAVPAAAAVTTHAYLAHISEFEDRCRSLMFGPETANEQNLADIRERIVSKPLSPRLQSLIERFLTALPSGVRSLAVRSSSTQEDEAGASWAGQYETYLNVPRCPREVGEAVKRCWSSIWQMRSIAYRRRLEAQSSSVRPMPAMAVVIQHQLNPSAAGVLFTLDPVTGDEDTFVVESVWGLGEGVVGGEITPHSFHVAWLDGTVRKSSAARQTVKYCFAERPKDGQWVQVAPTTPHEQQNPSLTAGQLRSLTAVGCTVASVAGHPQDIEWAVEDDVVYLLQARNITAYHLTTPIRYIDLRFENKSMFTLSKCARAYVEMFKTSLRFKGSGLKLRNSEHPLVDHFHHVYTESDFYFGYFAELDQARTRLDIIQVISQYTDVFDNVKSRSEAQEPLYHRIATSGFSDFSDAELIDAFHQLTDFQLAVDCSSYLIGEIVETCQQLVQKWLDALRTDYYDPRLEHLVQGVNVNSEPKRSSDLLAEAATALATDPDVREHYRSASVNSATTPPPAVLTFIDSYVRRFFYMSAADEDISQPRFREDHSTPLSILESLLRARCREESASTVAEPLPLPVVPPIERYQPVPIEVHDSDELYCRERDEIVAHLMNSTTADSEEAAEFQICISEQGLRLCLYFKETVHTLYVWSGYFLRRVIVELVRRAGLDFGRHHKGDTIDENHPIWCLTAEELSSFFPRTDNLRALRFDVHKMQARATKNAFFRNFQHPWYLQQGGVKIQTPKRTDTPSEKYVIGTGASAGTVEGTARIILSLTDAHLLQKGDVLITRYTDPSWTGLFALISAVVIEDGGSLSHAAVVARELGICAVVQAKNATKIFASGDSVLVDGSEGVVTLNSSAPSSSV